MTPQIVERTTKGSATRRWPCLSTSRPMSGPAMASTRRPTAETAPASPNEPRRSLSMTMTATPNIAPPVRASEVPAMKRVAPGTRNSGA